MRGNLGNVYRRVAIWLCLCLMIGILPFSSDSVSASSPSVKLIISGKYITKKTYKLEIGHGRQLNVKTNNTFGKTSIKYTSSNKNIATVNKNGLINSRNTGTAKISVKVTCKSGKKKRSTTTWTKIKIYRNGASASPTPSPASQIGGAMQAVLIVNGTNVKQFPMTILDNACGRMLYSALPKTLYLTDQNYNTKIGVDPEGIYYPMEEYKPKNLLAGDFMLFGNSRYELSYEDHTSGYAYTRLGRIMNPTGLKQALGNGPVSVTIIRSTLPSNPTPTPSLTPRPSASASPWPSGVPTPTYSGSPRPSSSPWPSGVPTPSTSPGASVSPGASTSPRPSGSATPTPLPVYVGPRIKIETNGFNYIANINQSCNAAMTFYNKLSYDKPFPLVMIPYNPVDRYYIADPAGLPTNEMNRDATRWPAGSLVLFGGDSSRYLMIFRQTVNNLGADGKGQDPSLILATIDPSEVSNGSGWLKTMFNGAETCTVNVWKA